MTAIQARKLKPGDKVTWIEIDGTAYTGKVADVLDDYVVIDWPTQCSVFSVLAFDGCGNVELLS